MPLRGYGDLAVLGELDVRRFLVTSDFRRLQESKIRALGIASLFRQIVIDAIDELGARGKPAIFQELMDAHQLTAACMLIVGIIPIRNWRRVASWGFEPCKRCVPGCPAIRRRRITSLPFTNCLRCFEGKVISD